MDHCEGGWVALWGGVVVPDVHFLCQPWSLGVSLLSQTSTCFTDLFAFALL